LPRSSMTFWLAPPSIKWIARLAAADPIRVLDVGCGFGAPSVFNKFFPNCEYHGLDQNEQSLLPGEKERMHRFYAANLETDSLDALPDGYFDAIVVSHVIEHLINGENALERLPRKLKRGGIIYIEYPGVKSLRVPHARKGFLHFHDDLTHVRLYSVAEVSNILLRSGCRVERAGTRRDLIRLAMSPALAMRGLLMQGDLWSGRLWDLFGIAEFVVARKT
jgi:ubiquinone/menaquinone biosynthesis C-methylase UbiE